MGIADGLSRLPTPLMQQPFIEDSKSLQPHPIFSRIATSGQQALDIRTPTTTQLAIGFRNGSSLGLQRTFKNKRTIKVENRGGKVGTGRGGVGESRVVVLLGWVSDRGEV